jgi:glycosyltransferase involved in cell wall biosynthesis
MRVLTLSTLFPDATRPNFGVFVEQQTLGLAAHPDVDLRVVAPIGLPLWPLSRHQHYRALADLPRHEQWRGLRVERPRFATLPGTSGRFHAAALTRALRPLLDRLRDDFAFEVIDASFFFPDGPAAVALGRRYGVPVSIKSRGADIHHWGRAPATAAQVCRAGQAADGLLAVSGAMRDDMAALGLPASRIRVHHTGVDLERFAPGNCAVLKRDLGVTGSLVVSVGALIPRKGHDVVIEALADLPHVTLAIAGEGPERAQLERLIAERSLEQRVRLLGSVPHADLPRWLAAADATALASTSEGLANAWIESLACGTPIVIPDAGGAREVVTDAAAGRIVARTPAAFAEALRSLLADPPASAATRRHAERFTWAANTSALHDHLAALVARAASASPQPTPLLI